MESLGSVSECLVRVSFWAPPAIGARPLAPFLGREGSPTKIDHRKKVGTPILTSGGPSHCSWIMFSLVLFSFMFGGGRNTEPAFATPCRGL